jgi:hypothetical protein
MLELYVNKEDIPKSDNLISFNDAFFNLRYGGLDIDDAIINIIKTIDGSVYLGNGRFHTKFDEIIGLDSISTGCKTVINVYKNPDKLFDCTECGNNALELIFRLKNGRVYCSMAPAYPDFYTPVDVMIHGYKNEKKHFSDLGALIDNWKDFL